MRSGDIDSWTVERDGITYQIDLFSDQDANADPAGQGDCYEAADVAAHDRGDWLFVGVVVTPVIDSEPVEAASDSLWSVEFGRNPGRWQHPAGVDMVIDRDYIAGTHPVPDMISEVRGKLAKHRGSLAGLSLD